MVNELMIKKTEFNCEYCIPAKKLLNERQRLAHYKNRHWNIFVGPFLDLKGLTIEERCDRGFFVPGPGKYVCFICEPSDPYIEHDFKKHLHSKHAAQVIRKIMTRQ